MGGQDLFNIIFNAFSPYMFAIANMALATTLFSIGLKILRQRAGGMGSMNGDQWGGIWTAFVGYLLCRGIPVIIGIFDLIVNNILAQMPR